MSISDEIREQVRIRAGFACEYCGVTEVDAAGELTVDHFHPQAQDGADTLDNLVYCCSRCNSYKSDYWPRQTGDPALWNPRQEPWATHFVELADGTLFPITDTGRFTLVRLRLNRAPLVAYRLRQRQQAEGNRLLERYRNVLDALERLSEQHAALLADHRALLTEQRRALFLVLQENDA